MLLDTNILSELMRARPNPAIIEWLDRQPADQLFVSSISRAEIELGIALLPEGKRQNELRSAAEDMFAVFAGKNIPFDELAAQQYGILVAERIRIGRPISVEDAQIAAIAIVRNLSLATRNSKDFAHIKDLLVINPWDCGRSSVQ